MRVNLYLFKKDISPKNLPIFTSKEDRETYFSESNADKAYKNISYNGTRNIRINENAFEANLDYYNYARINWTDKEDVEHNYYCFIDIVKYVNDNVSELQLTLDYVTTYYFDIKLKEFSLEQCTMKDDPFNRRGITQNENYRVYFENKCGCVYKPYKSLPLFHDIDLGNPNYKLKWLLVNLAVTEDVNFDSLYINGATKIRCILFPVIYNISEPQRFLYSGFTVRYTNDTGETVDITSSLRTLLDRFDGQILNISLIDNIFAKEYVVVTDTLPDVLSDTQIYIRKTEAQDGLYSIYIRKEFTTAHNLTTKFAFSLIQYGTEPNAEWYMFLNSYIQTYFHTFVKGSGAWDNKNFQEYIYAILNKNGNEEILEISQNDFEKMQTDILLCDISIDPIYPNNIMLQFMTQDASGTKEPLNKKIKNVIIPPSISGIQFDQTKWAEYYINNSASVNDGLATKHKYDLENADKQRTSAHIQGALNFVGGATGGMVSALGAGIAGNDAGVVKGAGQVITSAFSYASNITATEYAYQIAENNIEKEKALLEISWNDIKASPNSMYNYGSGNNILSYIDNAYVLYFMKPVDMSEDTARKYHMEYGYKINRKYSANSVQEYAGLNDIMLMFEDKDNSINDINYKFIRLDCDFVIDNLPLTVRKMLTSIFKDGVKFYNKNNMLIYNNPNFNNYIEPLTEEE